MEHEVKRLKGSSEGTLKITNIQRMCMHDGPGIRTTVFFKGCNLNCPWCCNPENISYETEEYTENDGSRGVYGKEYSADGLLEEILRDEEFFKYTGGGVTFSGGEALLQLWRSPVLLKELKGRNIHISVETALQIPGILLEEVLDYIDYFIVDIKILDSSLCRQVLGGNMELYNENLNLLNRKGKRVLFRIPCNKEYTATEGNLSLIVQLLSEYPDYDVEIFKVHNLGRPKYESLKREFRDFEDLSDGEMLNLKHFLEVQVSNAVQICKF